MILRPPDHPRSDAPFLAEAALVLGAAVWPRGQASPALQRRAEHAAKLYHDGQVRQIIASGGVGRHPPAEAEVIRDLCIACGVRDSDILTDTRATTTEENIRHGRDIARSAGIKTLCIVTDWYHAPRARLVARALGMKVQCSSPPLRGTRPLRLTRALSREIPALIYYAWRLRRK